MPSDRSTTTKKHPPIPVVFPLHLWQKMQAYIQACPVEINGFGTVEVREGVVHITDIFILDQVATGASVEVDETALQQYIGNLIRNGGDPGAIKFQWHSHVNMKAYFSGTDTDNIDRWTGDWLISYVGNKRGEYAIRYDQFRPVPLGDIAVYPMFSSEPSADLLVAAAAEVQAKVRQPGAFRRRRPVSAATPTPAELAVTEAVDSLFDGGVGRG
jgi:hypothetical protein